MADRQYCTFIVDGRYFGLDVLKVQEIIRYQEMTRVPLAPPVVRGLINLRGQIVTAIDLRRRLGLADRQLESIAGLNGHTRANFAMIFANSRLTV